MDINSLSTEFAQYAIEQIELSNGRELRAKKIPKKAIDSLESILPGIKYLVSATENNLEKIERIGSTPLFVAKGDISRYLRKSDNTFMSASVGADNRIAAQPGFEMTEQMKEGTKLAAGIGKAIPYVNIAITLIEIGVSIYHKQELIKAEEEAFYNDKLEKLSEYNSMLWTAMDDYSEMVSDEAVRGAYLVHILDIFNYSKQRFDEMKAIAENPANAREKTLETMKAALLVLSFAHLIKIMYAKKTESKTYIENAVKDIEKRTEDLNMMINRKGGYDRAVNVEKRRINKIAGQFASMGDNKTLEIMTAICTGGISYGAKKGTELLDKHYSKKTTQISNTIDDLRAISNPFEKCIRNLELMTSDSNLLLMDNEFVYYEIPEACEME